MTTYIPILDAEVAPDAPITTSLMTRLRDNLLAVVGGDSSAPSIASGIIAVGGDGVDAILTASTVITQSGYYEFASANVTAPLTLPVGTIIRINGNAVISSTITVTDRTIDTNVSGGVPTTAEATENNLLTALGFILGPTGVYNSGNSNGGANAGKGGGTTATPNLDYTNLNRPWLAPASVGGNGGGLGNGSGGTPFRRGNGGGAIVLIVDGNLTMTGGTIMARGRDSDNGGGGSADPGAGAGGTVKVICTGTLTDGTFNAIGGTGLNIPADGGGGGFVHLVAPTFTGTQTMTVTKGAGATNATDGVATKFTGLTRGDIRSMLQRRF